jgi:hypothetical protein
MAFHKLTIFLSNSTNKLFKLLNFQIKTPQNFLTSLQVKIKPSNERLNDLSSPAFHHFKAIFFFFIIQNHYLCTNNLLSFMAGELSRKCHVFVQRVSDMSQKRANFDDD